uniref:Uncharacterized protein n=1 Tax=Rhizophora mucronata TaxID=61149 RepID=A0A2P2N4J0_RHIMU
MQMKVKVEAESLEKCYCHLHFLLILPESEIKSQNRGLSPRERFSC